MFQNDFLRKVMQVISIPIITPVVWCFYILDYTTSKLHFLKGNALGFGNNNTLCNNGAIDDGEACDTTDLGGQSCVGLGYSSGALSCSAICGFDTSGCTAPVNCDDGVLDPGEDCDGANLGG